MQLSGRETSLGSTAAAATVEDLAMGPNGEWWVRYANGDWRIRGGADGMYSAMDKLKAKGKDIASVRFGNRYTWAILY